MTKLIISNEPLGEGRESEVILSIQVDKVNSDPDEILSCIRDDIKKFQINILMPQSKYDEIMNSREHERLIMLNVLTYPEDFIVGRKSVEAVGTLTKEQSNTIWAFLSGDTYEEIANKQFKSRHTINRHAQNLRIPLELDNKCLAIVALIRFIIEYWPGELKTKVRRIPGKIGRKLHMHDHIPHILNSKH